MLIGEEENYSLTGPIATEIFYGIREAFIASMIRPIEEATLKKIEEERNAIQIKIPS